MGKVLTFQEFVCDTFRSKSDLKYKEIIKRNGVLEKKKPRDSHCWSNRENIKFV